MNKLERFYPQSRFGGFTDIDGTIAFFNRINALVDSDSIVLDVGCGRGEYAEDDVAYRKDLRNLKGKAARVLGIDVDRAAEMNPCLDDFQLIRSTRWPVEDTSVDLVVADHVLEHINDPEHFFSECRRVLRKGGHLCLRTPNRWSYISLAASLIPNKFHAKVTSVVQEGRKQEDVFPTVYKCNTVTKLAKMMRAHGMSSVVYAHESEPSYLSFSVIAYYLGVLHQRFSPRFIKPVIFAFGRLEKRNRVGDTIRQQPRIGSAERDE